MSEKKPHSLSARKRKRRLVDYILGIVLLVVGLLGFILPVLPGWLFVFAGMALLGEQRFIGWFKNRYLERWLNEKNPDSGT